MSDPIISVVIPCHNETKMLERAAKSVLMQVEAPDMELILVCDRAADETLWTASNITKDAAGLKDEIRPVEVDLGDLGKSRNAGVEKARGRFVSFLDADDIFGAKWLRSAFEYAKRFDNDNFVLHPEWSVFFDKQHFVHRHYSCDSPAFDDRDIIQYNPWSALAFAPKSLLERFPYEATGDGWGFEDWHFNVRTLGASIPHHVVPEAVHFIRMKMDQTSLAARTVDVRATIRKMDFFNYRTGIRKAEHLPPRGNIPDTVVKQAMFAHFEVGEKRILMEPQMTLQVYPRQKIWDDHAWLRDQIGTSKHVILVDKLIKGGAEKYAIDWAEALAGKDPVIVETEAQEVGPWRKKAMAHARVVSWFRRNELTPDESLLALQRAIVQSELESLFVCNAPIGWALIGTNAEILAKRVIAASFAEILLPTGFSVCPPYHQKSLAKYTVLTDNLAHLAKMKTYVGHDADIVCLEPKASVSGGPHRGKHDRPRVLWAGRCTEEKRPMLALLIAQAMPQIDIHLWGDLRIGNVPPNLKLRGSFDSWDNIDGSYDCYLLTSVTEGMPNTALEAVLSGLPVIGSNVGDLNRIAAMTFECKPHKPIEEHANNAIKALTAWFAEWSETYEHDKPLRLVKGWSDDFAKRVQKLTLGG